MLVYKRVKLKPYLIHNYLIIVYLQKGIFSGFFTVIVAAIFFSATINLFKMFYSFFQASYFILKAASLGIKMFFQVFYFCEINEPNI